MDIVTKEKTLAAKAAVEHITSGMVIGLGSGSTAEIAVKILGEKCKNGLKITGVPSSVATRNLAESLGISLVDTVPENIDITIDGADEFDENLHLIKGGGGALLHEKIVASVSHEFIVIVDSRKTARPLGSSFYLPVEIIPYAQQTTSKKLQSLGCHLQLRKKDDKIFISDEGNYIIDCHFGEIKSPRNLAQKISQIPGVVEHGLFISMATQIIIGCGESTKTLSKPRG